MADSYRDGLDRYHGDAEFHQLVDVLYHFAVRHGYTPGELKQAAFVAALKAEQHAGYYERRAAGTPGGPAAGPRPAGDATADMADALVAAGLVHADAAAACAAVARAWARAHAGAGPAPATRPAAEPAATEPAATRRTAAATRLDACFDLMLGPGATSPDAGGGR